MRRVERNQHQPLFYCEASITFISERVRSAHGMLLSAQESRREKKRKRLEWVS